MNPHQLITGALNRAESVFAIGSVEGIRFTACAVGCDIVILASDFQRVQIIPGASSGDIQVACIDACSETGKIAAALGDVIKLYHPTPRAHQTRLHKLDYVWFETNSISVESPVSHLSFNLEGLRILVGSDNELQLWQHPTLTAHYSGVSQPLPDISGGLKLDLNGDPADSHALLPRWDCVWRNKLSSPIRYMKFSPDGSLFATAGPNDTAVKMWYQDLPDFECGPDVEFSFLYLNHPEAVQGLEFRRLPRYMPRHYVANVLVTWCRDHICRLWMETMFPSDGDIDFSAESHQSDSFKTRGPRRKGQNVTKLKGARQKITHNLKKLKKLKHPKRNGRRMSPGGMMSDPGSPTSLSFPVISEQNALVPAMVHFHLACSINAETDCFLVPSMSTTASESTFAIHWLNNKDFVFSIGAEKILTEALLAEQQSMDSEGVDRLDTKSPAPTENGVAGQWSVDSIPTATTPSRAESTASVESSSKDVTDVKLEFLLREWYNSSDVLFAIHPIDGSLLVWTVEWLDDPSRQPAVSFSSRLPGAFPLTDAISLHHNLVSFNPHYPSYVRVLRRNVSAESQANEEEEESYSSIFLLTNHDNGSLNLWHLSVEGNFSTILNLSHISRMCGHRFRIDRIVCHPILPLFLTTSHHRLQKQHTPAGAPKNVSSNFMHFNAEVILWKVNPVGPLCKSGGVRELSRINSPELSAFVNVAWIPAVLPSSTLGSVCNSPSSCFVASDGKCLRVYQAVLDARALLAELNFGKTKKGAALWSSEEGSSGIPSPVKTNLTFPVCSTQSTSRPGCILQLAPISSDDVKDWKEILFLHVFPESAVLGSQPGGRKEDPFNLDLFEEKFFVVLLESRGTEVVLHMWMVDMKSQPPAPLNKGKDAVIDDDVSSPEPDTGFYPTAQKQPPSAAQLYIRSKKVCTQSLVIENGKIEDACPSAGHLPTASMYPGYQAPYLIMTSCSDEQVRFWKCRKEESGGFLWEEWGMVSGSRESSVELEGRILALNSAHSGRLACAYDPTGRWNSSDSDTVTVEVAILECESTGGTEWNREDTVFLKNIKIPNERQRIPSGDLDFNRVASPVDEMLMEWHTNPQKHPGATLMPRIPSIPKIHTDLRPVINGTNESRSSPRVVRIDFVATEDGSHILTISVGPKIFLLAPVSEDLAQQNIVIMKESEVHKKRPVLQKASSLAANVAGSGRKLVKWVKLRTVELDSVNGLPALPMTISWVRDGILVIGMESEMRVYNQWRFLFQDPKTGGSTKEPGPEEAKELNHLALPAPGVQRALSPSHSVLDLAKKAKENPGKKAFTPSKKQQDSSSGGVQDSVVDIVSDGGLFEASRLASPMLPQYHPKQLMELLNAGKTRRVKAILLHVLRCIQERNVVASTGLAKHGSIRRPRQSLEEREEEEEEDALGVSRPRSYSQVGVKGMMGEEVALDYEEIESIPPLPLHAILAADSETGGAMVDGDSGVSDNSAPAEQQYDELFNGGLDRSDDEDIDSALDMDEDDSLVKMRHRLSSVSDQQSGINFGAKHCRILTRFLTHLHLPGLSSVDQMHLLAVADTLSSFSPDVIDRLAQANAGFTQKSAPSGVIESSAGGGYASVGSGAETVDECGLRYLMAMKQHEYLTMCLPMKQRSSLRSKGLSSSHITWALHSETETELLNSISCLQKGTPTWAELRALGLGWWLKNGAVLRVCVEKIAKAAFQKKQDPMDAAMFYLAMKKKNVLTHLFRSVRDVKMSDFFSRNFEEALWKKAALKNAFVLMGKQRFSQAVGFFLLGGALSDAIQTCLNKLHDLQLAMVIIRLYESETERQNECLKKLLCTEILGCQPSDVGSLDEEEGGECPSGASPDPFLRSMAFWHLKEYAKAASTLLEEAGSSQESPILSDVFNFYIYLRNHPLVIRQKLAQGGITIGSTEKFLAVAKRLQSQITPAERKLYFRAAATHFHSGCALLALEVLCRLPKRLRLVLPGSTTLSSLVGEEASRRQSVVPPAEILDWGASVVEKGPQKKEEDELKLEWSDDEKDEDSDEEGLMLKTVEKGEEKNPGGDGDQLTEDSESPLDVMAQQMKFVCCLKILMEELATLASGYEVEGGSLRYQLFIWLEKETAALKDLCDYNVVGEGSRGQETEEGFEQYPADSQNPTLLHEALQCDRADMTARWESAVKRRRWLSANQQLLRTFASYCALHGSQGVGLASARMELLLLLLELHQEPATGPRSLLASPVPLTGTFPLLFASVASFKTDTSDPIRFLQGQARDLLMCFRELSRPPLFQESLSQMYVFYNLSQCLSACTYNALSDMEKVPVPKGANVSGYLLRKRRRTVSATDDGPIITLPSKWPGVQNMVAVLSRSFDDDLPSLRLLLVETFVSIYLALFTYSFTSYDSRWLFRLVAHPVTPEMFAAVFGGGAEKKLETLVEDSHQLPPPRPPPPRPGPAVSRDRSPINMDKLSSTVDPASLRAKFHARVFGPAQTGSPGGGQSLNSSSPFSPTQSQTVMKWIPPKQSLVAYFMSKPPVKAQEELGIDYDSDDSYGDGDSDGEEESKTEDQSLPEHLNPHGYAWFIMRLALVKQTVHRVHQFLTISGLETGGLELAGSCPRVHACLKTLEKWEKKLMEALDSYPGGCPPEFLPHKYLDAGGATGPSLHKYRSILEPGNSPFESEDPAALPVRRLWLFLVRQEHLMEIFIRYIFKGKARQTRRDIDDGTGTGLVALPEPMKIIQREQDPILSFGVSNCNPGWIVVSTGRELQEMDISAALQSRADWMHDPTELDIALAELKRNALVDNDDYLLVNEGDKKETAVLTGRGSSFLCKRQVSGIRRMEAHPSLPYYVTGASDGSVRLWEWGVAQPLYTPRVAGQFAKVSRTRFSLHGNKFGITDGDGVLCLWQASQSGVTLKKPYFSVKCHCKSAADFIFIGGASSLLATAGLGTGDNNLGLWDTLQPIHKALIHSWPCHPEEGALALQYVPNHQVLISGGKNGELSFWDLRQRQLRHSCKAFQGSSASVKSLAVDPAVEYLACGSSDGDVSIWSLGAVPQLLYSLTGEHSPSRSGILRSSHGSVQLVFDGQGRLYSCGGDSLRLRLMP